MPATLVDIQREKGLDVFPIYKEVAREPYIESGYGYRGDLLTNGKGYFQCHECGKWCKHLGKHVRVHKLLASEYRSKHGLAQRIPQRQVGHVIASGWGSPL